MLSKRICWLYAVELTCRLTDFLIVLNVNALDPVPRVYTANNSRDPQSHLSCPPVPSHSAGTFPSLLVLSVVTLRDLVVSIRKEN